MEKFFQYFKGKLSLENDNICLLRNIILNDNTLLIKQNFNIFYENKTHNLNDLNYFYCSLFLCCLDIHREFKKKLLSKISSKLSSYQETNKYINNFLSFINLDYLSTNDVNEIKYKILLLNNLYDISMKYFEINKKDKNNKNIDEDNDKENVKLSLLKNFFTYFINSLEKKEFSFLLKDSNDEIGMILTFYINCLLNIINYISNNKINYDFNNTLNIIEEDLIDMPLDYSIKTKDLLFIYSNFYFNIYLKSNKNNLKDLKGKAEFIFSKCLSKKNYEIIFSYIKGLYNNFDYTINLDSFLLEKFDIFNIFIEEKAMINNGEKEFKKDFSLADFYLYFLEHNINGKYSLIINDIIVLILSKVINTKEEKIKKELFTWINNNKLIDLILIKIKNEKNNFNFIEDNFFDILSLIYNKTTQELKKNVSIKINQYLIDIKNSNKRPLTNECTLFQYIKEDIKKGLNDSKKTLIDFMILILSFPYDKKDISLIMENAKNFFDYYKEQKYYNEFYQTFPVYFIKYLQKIPVQYLQNLNSLYLQLNKLNPNLYFLIVKYCYNYISKTIQIDNNSINQEEFISIYGVFFALLRPVRLQKKSLGTKENQIIIFNNKIKEEIKIDIDFISDLVLSTNEYLTLSIIEFVNEMDDKNQTFKIIMRIIKYGIKNQNQEYKGGLSKSLRIYFSQYFIIMNKLLSNNDKNNKKNIDLQGDIKYLDIALNKNIIKICNFLSDNIYDRPVENLLTYLELLKLIVYLIDENFYKIKNESSILTNFKLNYEKIIFEKGLFLSLISLLKHSWNYVRINSYEILSNNKYNKLFLDNKIQLIKEIKKYCFSLRQMDIEGSSCLFVLLLLHYNYKNKINDEIINDIFKQIFDYDIKQFDFNNKNNFICENNINRIIEIMFFLINERKNEYINLIKTNSEIFDIKKCSIHSFFIFIRNIIDLQKNNFLKKSSNLIETLNLFFKLSSYIISLNTEFLDFLINNGVSEFTLDEQNDINEDLNENATNVNHENKLMISLWNSSKYSLNILNTILDIFSSNYPNLSSSLESIMNNEFNLKDVFLIPLKNNFTSIIPIVIKAKHMGVVRSMSDCLFKISILLNKSVFSMVCKEEIEVFLEKELSNHVVSSILRRSAGIPFLITTLIRSYITENYSYNFIKSILKNTILSLLNNFKKYQDKKMDASVHCLNILRVICDDTIIKPFVKDFYDEIIMDIINGLQSKNWSIKNACMLMFSRIITNNFLLQNEAEMQRTLLTFKEYFYDKNDFYRIIIDIISKNNSDSKLNDCLLLFITFFTKMRHSKPSEYKNERIEEIIKLLFTLDKKDNKLFRKLLSSALFKLYGNNFEKFIIDVKEKITIILDNNKENHIDIIKDNNKYLEINNQIDFYYNIINELIKLNNNEVNEEEKLDLIILFKKLVSLLLKGNNDKINTYFGISKYIQLIKKLQNIYKLIENKDEKYKLLNDINNNFELIGIDLAKKTINLNKLFIVLEKNSRLFNFFKFIKHAFSLFVDKLNYKFEKTNLIKYFKNKKLEEILVIIFKRYSKYISFEFIANLFLSDGLKNLINYSVNISSHLILFIEKIIKSKTLILSEEKKKILFNEIINILKENKDKTKLITKLFSIMPYLLIYKDENKNECLNELNSAFNLIYKYIQSDSLDKLRIAGLLCLDKIIKDISFNNNYNKIFKENEDIKLQILKILFLLLNDEYSNIRKKASEIFILFNKLALIIPFKSNYTTFINEYICHKILTKININGETNKKFYFYIMENNFYFRINVLESKIFYIEPDNNYIDNSQSRILLIKNILKNKIDIGGKKKLEEYKYEDKIMMAFEEFTEKIKIICNNIIKTKAEKLTNYEHNKYIYKNLVRPKIYLLNKYENK